VYRQGEDAVVALVTGLLSQNNRLMSKIERLEARLEVLENQTTKNSRNSSNHRLGMALGSGLRVCVNRVSAGVGVN
jgi:hypothetical protein